MFIHRAELQKRRGAQVYCATYQYYVIHSSLPSHTLEPADTQKYLGIIIDRHLTWKLQQEYAASKARQGATQLYQIAKPSYGITPSLMKRIYLTAVATQATYCADVWITPIHKTPGTKRKQGSVAAIRRLAQVQHTAAIRIRIRIRTKTLSIESRLTVAHGP
jgi:hypothetical protein